MIYEHFHHASATDGCRVLFVIGCQVNNHQRNKVERLMIGEGENYMEMPELVGKINYKISAFLMANRNEM